MGETYVPVGMIFLSQTVVGILGNFSLLYHCLFLSCMGDRMRGTDLILRHLIVANFLSLLCRGIPQTMAAWGWRDFLSDLGCKLVSYVYRVSRGVAIGSTCSLSVFQAFSISPGASRWAGLKGRAHKHIVSMVYLSWGVSLLVNIVFLMYITKPKTLDNTTMLKAYGYCFSVRHNPAAEVLYVALLSVPDVLGLGLMLWASISMLFILYTHKLRMQHIQRTSVSCRASPESRATKSILLLVSTFVSFYTWSCICQIFLCVTYNPSPVLLHMAAFAMGCFPAVSPFLLMSGHSTPYSRCFDCRRGKNTILS
ncbi:vomeronasal type-1 receptor 4-like [Perognathus longimembris pacificus]|uniref:vomeronasal type-1 receptor 4-like n=1 Tax=Perognathus longimembris pacificus TaxID=214514 RepID=UPI002018E55A|nr:vomeronasal type-1 receptor 4-like [Perognathus longimembris pacificus]